MGDAREEKGTHSGWANPQGFDRERITVVEGKVWDLKISNMVAELMCAMHRFAKLLLAGQR